MPQVLEKVERRLGEKLLLKGDRCAGPKCAAVRRGYPPGMHGKKRRRGGSEYLDLLRMKQKIRFLYGLDDRDIKRYSMKAATGKGIFSTRFVQFLERRLDNVVFRLGFTPSRRTARQLINHGHITVGEKTVNIPSYRVKQGERIAIKDRSLSLSLFTDLDLRMKNMAPPKWLHLDKEKKVGMVQHMPEVGDAQLLFDVTRIKEFYSR